MHFCVELDIIVKVFRGVAQVVERYFREVEAASSSLVTPIEKALIIIRTGGCQGFFVESVYFRGIFVQSEKQVNISSLHKNVCLIL